MISHFVFDDSSKWKAVPSDIEKHPSTANPGGGSGLGGRSKMRDKELIAAFGNGPGLTGGNKFYYQIFPRLVCTRQDGRYCCHELDPFFFARFIVYTHSFVESRYRAASRAVATLVGFTFLPKSIPDRPISFIYTHTRARARARWRK